MKARRLLIALLIVTITAMTGCTPGGTTPAATTAAGSTSTQSPNGAADSGDANFNPVGYPIVNEVITLSATQCVRDVDDLNYEDMPFYDRLEELTNVKIDWSIVKQADWSTKLNLMFASNSYTDMILGGSNGILDCDEYGANQQILLPLDEYLEQYMPNYYERLQMNNVNDSMPSSDGKSYFIGYFRAEGINTSGHYFINTTWLDRLNLEMPNTVDELTNVLRAFKTGDPNQNGIADEVPYQSMFTGTMAGLVLAFPFWGIPEADGSQYVMIDDDGIVKFTGIQPGYREACEWLNLIYTEGLVDPECITQDQSVFAAKLNSGTVGYFPYWRLENVGIADEVVAEFEVCLPVHAEGYDAKMSRRIELPGFGAALTVTCSNIPAALRWLDAQLDTETMLGVIPGNENIFLNSDGKWEAYTEEADLTAVTGQYPGVNGMYFAPADWYFENFQFGWNILEKSSHCAWYEEAGVMENISSQYATQIAKMSTTDKEELTRLQTEIIKFMEESITSFMVSGVTDSGWQNYLNMLDKLNITRYVELYQLAYDGYLAL